MQTIDAALCFNRSFTPLATGALASIAAHAAPGRLYRLYIVHRDISPEQQYRLRTCVSQPNIELHFIYFDVEHFFRQKLPVSFQFTSDMYTRLLLHRILPDVQRVVYLDADLVLNVDLASLYEIDLQNCPLAAVNYGAILSFNADTNLDPLAQFRRDGEFVSQVPGFECYANLYDYFTQYLQLPEQRLAGYFSSGAMLLDLRKIGPIIDRELPAHIGRQLVMADQDLLNILFCGQALMLDISYCVYPNQVFKYMQLFGRMPAIIHYAGGYKPHYTPHSLGAAAYWKYLSQTEQLYPELMRFIDSRIEQARLKNMNYKQEIEKLQQELSSLRSELEQLRRPRQHADAD